MKLIVGLGNPGAKYAGNRHNVGFMAVDAIAARHGFSPWREKFGGLLAEGSLGGEKTVLLKPATYMNESGNAAGAALRFFKMDTGDVIVLHDELDLPPGRIRVKSGGGHAGHNGLRSLDQHIGSDYTRVRIGIGHPGDKRLVSHWVLSDFAKADRDWLDPLIAAMADAAPRLAKGDAAGFAGVIGQAAAPAKERPGEKPKASAAAKASAAVIPPTAADRGAAAGEGEAAKSLLQRLIDRFS